MLDQIQLLRGGQAEVDPRPALQVLGVVLGDGACQEVAATVAGAPSPPQPVRSTGGLVVGCVGRVGRDAGRQRQHVRHGADRRTCGSGPRTRRRSRGFRPPRAARRSRGRRAPGWSRTRTADRSVGGRLSMKRGSIVVLFCGGVTGAAVAAVAVERLAEEDVRAGAHLCAGQAGDDPRILRARRQRCWAVSAALTTVVTSASSPATSPQAPASAEAMINPINRCVRSCLPDMTFPPCSRPFRRGGTDTRLETEGGRFFAGRERFGERQGPSISLPPAAQAGGVQASRCCR